MKKVTLFVGRLLRETFWIAVAVGLVAGGVIGFRYLGENRQIVEAQPAARPVALVETVQLEPLDGPLPIRGEGFVAPLRQLSVSSQVSGRVIEIHPAIAERGRFTKGDVLIRLDDRAQVAALTQAEANIAATETRLAQNVQDLDRTRALLERGVATQTQLDDLVSARDELEANLDGFEAAKLSAEISLSDQVIEAPFDGAVLSKSVEVGDVVSPGQALAEVFTEGELEIDVPVRQVDAALIPGLFSSSQAAATVDIPFADYVFRWNASVSRVEPQVDQITRTLTVTLRLNELENVEGRTVGGHTLASGAPPALINAYATVVIDGIEPEDTYRVPSTALRGGANLWIYDNGVLAVAEVDPIHVDGEDTYVQVTDLPEDTQVIFTALAAPVPGMQLRDVNEKVQAALTGSAQ
ncbi:efflux RND transporter periplasmic adaptor subunit [Aestuariibius sp. 2305UL40-4]|uniref:efflux RND transporter periplasmic adaptor subunit n=1 Tax=Aestuariibius violaceus TaxID=3234132 RepID=UPI00345F095F